MIKRSGHKGFVPRRFVRIITQQRVIRMCRNYCIHGVGIGQVRKSREVVIFILSEWSRELDPNPVPRRLRRFVFQARINTYTPLNTFRILRGSYIRRER